MNLIMHTVGCTQVLQYIHVNILHVYTLYTCTLLIRSDARYKASVNRTHLNKEANTLTMYVIITSLYISPWGKGMHIGTHIGLIHVYTCTLHLISTCTYCTCTCIYMYMKVRGDRRGTEKWETETHRGLGLFSCFGSSPIRIFRLVASVAKSTVEEWEGDLWSCVCVCVSPSVRPSLPPSLPPSLSLFLSLSLPLLPSPPSLSPPF